MGDRTEEILHGARALLSCAASAAEIEELRVRYLGRKGVLAELFASIPQLPAENRSAAGQAANRLKQELANLVREAGKRVGRKPLQAAAPLDVTMPGHRPALGHVHPIALAIEEITDIFRTLGFSTAEGPEVEMDRYNFDALNIPPEHPSRDAFDTFFVSDHVLLRSHTSPAQIRAMERLRPPIRIIAPGRCFRPDTEDARHSAMFHQVEGLMVDEGVSFRDLKAVLHLFAREFFQEDVEVRFLPSFFPFTEPSAEVDCTCPACQGNGCSMCSFSGWLEMLGAGMVHPNVFDAVGYDPERYTGFAFGMGVERLAMVKHRVSDIRMFYQGDARFLRQF